MSGVTLTVELPSGGAVTLSYDVDVLNISDEDGAFLLEIFRTMLALKAHADAAGVRRKEGNR